MASVRGNYSYSCARPGSKDGYLSRNTTRKKSVKINSKVGIGKYEENCSINIRKQISVPAISSNSEHFLFLKQQKIKGFVCKMCKMTNNLVDSFWTQKNVTVISPLIIIVSSPK